MRVAVTLGAAALASVGLLACGRGRQPAEPAGSSSGVRAAASTASVGSEQPSSTAAVAKAPLAKGSCHNAGMGLCTEFVGDFFAPKGVDSACIEPGLSYLPGACPGRRQIGSCVMHEGQALERSYRYYPEFPGGAAQAARHCANVGGRWVR